SLSARRRTADAYLDTLQRLVAFEVDPLEAERGDLERFLARNRRGRWGDPRGRFPPRRKPRSWPACAASTAGPAPKACAPTTPRRGSGRRAGSPTPGLGA